MKCVAFILALTFASVATADEPSATSPINKVIDLLSNLESKITKEKAAAISQFTKFSEWCENQAKNLEYEIKTGTNEVAQLEASIEQETASASAFTDQIDEQSTSIAKDEADLKAAMEIRKTESEDFAASEKELVEVIEMLERAVGVLEREMSKGQSGSALLQGSFSSVTQALGAIVDASVVSAADASRLASLLQSSQDSADGSLELGAPAAAVYESHSQSLIETLRDLLEKAQSQLQDARKSETTALHSFELLKQGLEDQIKFATKDLADAKKSLAQSGEKKAAAESDLAMTSKNLDVDKTGLTDLNRDCMTKAQDHEAADRSRAEELAALAEAKQAISEMTSGAASGTYSFLQVGSSRLSSRADLANFEAVHFVRNLARKNGNDPALAQLASRMALAMTAHRAGEDPFAKVKALISGMINRLQEEAGADATQKAFCDKEISGSKTKKGEHDAAIDKMTIKIDQLTARSKQLKEQVAELSKGLHELAASRAEMTKLRQEEHAVFVKSKADLEQGIAGVKLALKVLREYYGRSDKAHNAAEGSGTSIIGLLEVCESDFSKGLNQAVVTEEDAARAYEQEEKENEIEKATKEKDVEYKTKEAAKLDKTISEVTADRATVQTELDAVNEYITKLEEQCIAKPETYEARKAHREAEIAGLKEALTILENEALIQTKERRTLSGFRGEQDPCAGCNEESAQAYQVCAKDHGNPCAETNAAGLVIKGQGTKKDVGCCLKKEKHDRCLQCKTMDCSYNTCNVNKRYYSEREMESKFDDKAAMKGAGWGF